MTTSVARRLRGFPETAGYDAATAKASLAEAYGRRGSLSRLRQEFERLSTVALAAWQELAADLDQPLPRVLRNLVACADRDDVDTYFLCLTALARAKIAVEALVVVDELAMAVSARATWATSLLEGLSTSNRAAVKTALASSKVDAESGRAWLAERICTGSLDDPQIANAVRSTRPKHLASVLNGILDDPRRRAGLLSRLRKATLPSVLVAARDRVTDDNLRALLAVLTAAPSERPARLRESGVCGLSRVVSLLGGKTSARLIAASYVEDAPGTLRLLVSSVAWQHISSATASTLLQLAFPRPGPDVIDAWLQVASDNEVKAALQARGILSSSLRRSPAACLAALASRVKPTRARALATFLVEGVWRSASTMRGLVALDATRAEEAFSRTLEHLDGADRSDLSARLVQRLSRCEPQLALKLSVRRGLSGVESLLSARVVSPLLADAAVAQITDDLFDKWLSQCGDRFRRVNQPLVRAVCRAGGARLRRALRKAPDTFVAPALATRPLSEVVSVALESPDVAARVQKTVSRKSLRALLPWVRQHWAERPKVAAAYEVALAGSLVDARYLVWLAHRCGPPKLGGSRGQALDSLYHIYRVPKKAGGHRTITAPDGRLKRLQRRLTRTLLNEVPVARSATGFHPGGSVVRNAAPHVGQRLVINVDIDSFFDSTRYESIVGACRLVAAGALSERARFLLADVCSYSGHLPTGAPTSPALANLVLRSVDRALEVVSARHGIAYTRYADDLSFSGGDNVPRILPFATRLLAELGYAIDEKKTNLFRRGRRQVVTGLVVNDKPNLPRRLRRRLRAAVHRRALGLSAHWHGKEMSDSELVGRLAQLNTVQPLESAAYREVLHRAPATSPQPSETP